MLAQSRGEANGRACIQSIAQPIILVARCKEISRACEGEPGVMAARDATSQNAGKSNSNCPHNDPSNDLRSRERILPVLH
jgi:hypothetical protein